MSRLSSDRRGHFIRWCEKRDITNCNDLTGRLLHEYRIWRRNDGDLAPPSERCQMNTLRVFVRWLGTIDGCDPDLHLTVRSPKLAPGEHARTEMLDSEHAEPMLAYLEKYEYATSQHVVLSLLRHTMLRVGAARALDLRDYDREERFLAVVD